MSRGYYTVEWVGAKLSASQRIAAETRFARFFEEQLGGADAASEMCLCASAGDANAATTVVQTARAAEAAVKSELTLPEGNFSMRAWTAIEFQDITATGPKPIL